MQLYLKRNLCNLTTVMNFPSSIPSLPWTGQSYKICLQRRIFYPLTHFFTSLSHLPLLTFSLNPSEQLQGSNKDLIHSELSEKAFAPHMPFNIVLNYPGVWPAHLTLSASIIGSLSPDDSQPLFYLFTKSFRSSFWNRCEKSKCCGAREKERKENAHIWQGAHSQFTHTPLSGYTVHKQAYKTTGGDRYWSSPQPKKRISKKKKSQERNIHICILELTY